MVKWSHFFIKTLGVHFSNSALDNKNWDKMNYNLTKKIHLCNTVRLKGTEPSYQNYGTQVKYTIAKYIRMKTEKII